MLMKWQSRLLFFFFCIVSSVSTRWISEGEEEYGVDRESDKSKYHVDYFVLALEWPEGICEYINETGRHKCVISQQVDGWVLHGLWPSLFGHHHHHLGYCNHTKKFDFNKVKDIQGKLAKYWPNLFKDSKTSYLWKHEYEKHGTCAALVRGFETEHEYFSKAMGLLHKYNPMETLESREITPRKKAYDSGDIISAFTDKYGVKTCTQCSYVDDVGDVLSGLQICLSKELHVIDCQSCGTKYTCKDEIYYHPINFRQ